MKNTMRFTVLAGMMAASLFWLQGCGNTSQQHMDDAKENLKEAGQDLSEAAKAAREEAKTKATADWQQFKHESDSTIAVMDMQIKKLNESMAKADKKERERLSRDLNNAEAKLSELKAKLEQQRINFEADLKQFDETVAAKNESFRNEFKHDMDELGTAIKDLFTNNVK